MNVDTLREIVASRWGAAGIVTEYQDGNKRLVRCYRRIVGDERHKSYEKAIIFNAASIPDNAAAKLERALA
jgi:hypothetical protein